MSEFEDKVRAHFDAVAPTRRKWIERNRFFYESDWRYLQFLIPAGSRVIEPGSGTGELLAKLRPSRGLGIDISPRMVELAQASFPDLEFRVGNIENADTLSGIDETFDYIVLSDTLGSIEDCQALFARLHRLCGRDTRLIISYYSHLWEPILALAERLGQKMPQPEQNWLAPNDISGLLGLADFEVIGREWLQLLPERAFGLGWLVNRFLAPLPVLRKLCLRHYAIARSLQHAEWQDLTVSVVVPCRNERGNIEGAVLRTPKLAKWQEIIFVEGNSTDGTYEECERVRAAYPDHEIQVMRQSGKGKGDAVRKGFAAARGDILVILDADLTVPPESLPKFISALSSGKGEFINGSRLVYPFESGAMRFLNTLANRAFAAIFSWLLNQRFTDTLCGTKVLRKTHYDKIVANRAYFGDFDPFGDFDLIFGAAKLNLKIIEVPIRSADRRYGETNISRFRHGWLLLRMVVFAFRKMKIA